MMISTTIAPITATIIAEKRKEPAALAARGASSGERPDKVKGRDPGLPSKIAPRGAKSAAVLLNYIDDTPGTRIDQYRSVIHDRVPISPRDVILRRYIIVGDATLR
jgi:hypothetical protein